MDIAEAHYAQISVLTLSGVLGPELWSNIFPGLGLQLKVEMCCVCVLCEVVSFQVVLVYGTLVFTLWNLLHALYIVLTSGVGKNGSTVAVSVPALSFHLSSLCPSQDTSVLSPIISPVVITTTLVYYALYSPSQLMHTHYLLFFAAFGLQVTKTALLMMVSWGERKREGVSVCPCSWQA